MTFTVLTLVKSHKGIELHFGYWCFSSARKREERKAFFESKGFGNSFCKTTFMRNIVSVTSYPKIKIKVA